MSTVLHQRGTPTFRDELSPLQSAVKEHGAQNTFASDGFSGTEFSKFDRANTTLNTSVGFIESKGAMLASDGDISADAVVNSINSQETLEMDETVFSAEQVFSSNNLMNSLSGELTNKVQSQFDPVGGVSSNVNQGRLESACNSCKPANVLPVNRNTGEPNAVGVRLTIIDKNNQ